MRFLDRFDGVTWWNLVLYNGQKWNGVEWLVLAWLDDVVDTLVDSLLGCLCLLRRCAGKSHSEWVS
jgi:hypothetical protein